jgi:hypothetical protein
LIYVSKDGGVSWKLDQFTAKLMGFQRLLHKKERVYATLNGYRNDDFTSYVYISDDYGQTWTSIGNVPVSPVNVIAEDNINENILYLGTDNGLYVL